MGLLGQLSHLEAPVRDDGPGSWRPPEGFSPSSTTGYEKARSDASWPRRETVRAQSRLLAPYDGMARIIRRGRLTQI